MLQAIFHGRHQKSYIPALNEAKMLCPQLFVNYPRKNVELNHVIRDAINKIKHELLNRTFGLCQCIANSGGHLSDVVKKSKILFLYS